MGLRIVKQTEIKPDAYQVGKDGPSMKAKPFLLETINKSVPGIDPELFVQELEEKIFQEAMKFWEGKAKFFFSEERERIQNQYRLQWENDSKKVESELLELAIEVATNVCRHEISINKEITMTWIKEGLNRLGREKRAFLKVNSEEYEAIAALKDALMKCREELLELIVQIDPQVKPGGAIIQSDNLLIDAKLETRIDEIKKNLRAA